MKLIVTITLVFMAHMGMSQVFATNDGHVHFISDAPLEIIEASSDKMQGLVDLEKKIFAFKLYIKSFYGFNSPLQQIHFYENYMEVSDYPHATFKGKILERILPGKATYRAKGVLEIHGQPVERIIEIELDIDDEKITYSSVFLVPLIDHDIDLPQIVYQKIAETIKVTVDGTMPLRE